MRISEVFVSLSVPMWFAFHLVFLHFPALLLEAGFLGAGFLGARFLGAWDSLVLELGRHLALSSSTRVMCLHPHV